MFPPNGAYNWRILKYIIWLALFFSTCTGVVSAQKAAPVVQRFVITGPTVVAFFCTDKAPTTGESEQNFSDGLSDFDYYLRGMEERLHRAGIEFKVVNEGSFETVTDKSLRVFKTSKIGVGYYLIAPGKGPHLERGVMTGDDLVDIARKYLRGPNPIKVSLHAE